MLFDMLQAMRNKGRSNDWIRPKQWVQTIAKVSKHMSYMILPWIGTGGFAKSHRDILQSWVHVLYILRIRQDLIDLRQFDLFENTLLHSQPVI